MIVSYREGDLVAQGLQDHDAIAHGCNCFHTMGAGIAPLIKKKYPEAFFADCATPKGEPKKLGSLSFARSTKEGGYVYNLYTQFGFNGAAQGKIDLDYDALARAFKSLDLIAQNFKQENGRMMTLAIPLIGCGLAGGDWNRVSNLINQSTPNILITVFVLPKR